MTLLSWNYATTKASLGSDLKLKVCERRVDISLMQQHSRIFKWRKISPWTAGSSAMDTRCQSLTGSLGPGKDSRRLD